MWRHLIWSLRIRRVEYRIAELPLYLIPILLVVPDAAPFADSVFWEGLVIFLFLFAFGDLLNCLADRDLDAIYKPHLSEAVRGLGAGNVAWQAAFSALGAFGLTVHLAWQLDRRILVPGVLLGLFLAYAYSVEPFRLKGRGLWQLAFYWLGLFAGPMIFAALLFDPWPPWEVLSVALSYGLMQTGVLLVNTAEDLPEDREQGVRTVVLAIGLQRSMVLAFVFAICGGLALLASFLTLSVKRELPWQALVALTPLVGTWAVLSCALARLALRVRRSSEDNALQAVRACGRWVPAWITSLALSSLVAAFVWWRFQA